MPRRPHQQFIRQQQTDLPLFHKEYGKFYYIKSYDDPNPIHLSDSDAPPPYSFTACPPPPLATAPPNCLIEEQQNQMNAQREEHNETEQK